MVESIEEGMITGDEGGFQFSTRPLSIGATGTDVKVLQAALGALGYDVGKVDGNFDKKTEDALKLWMAQNNVISPTGAFEPSMINILREDLEIAGIPLEMIEAGVAMEEGGILFDDNSIRYNASGDPDIGSGCNFHGHMSGNGNNRCGVIK